MNDLWLFLDIILFIFVLWVYSGGPNNPISFAGPYITPVTAPGVAQVGYGPSANTFYRNANSGSGSNAVTNSARSPYAGKVTIAYSDPRSSNVTSEYLHIHSNATQTIDVTGWQLVSAQSGAHIRIPDGTRGNGGNGPIDLSANDDVFIITGSYANDSLKSTYAGAWHTFLNESTDVWNNTSDTITLLDQSGKVVDQYSY